MRLGIIGLPAVGKTTVFNALTGEARPTGAWGGGRVEVHTAVVDVPDSRLEAVSELFHPRKTTNAQVTYADIGGLQAAAGREGLPGALVNQLEQMDGLVHVVRAFEDPNVPHSAGSVNAVRDIQAMEAELLLQDMLTMDRRLSRLSEDRGKIGGKERVEIDRQLALFERVSEALGEERPLRSLGLTEEEKVALAGYALLTLKPVLVIINVAEGQQAPQVGPLGEAVEAIALQGKLEMDIAQLAQEEAEAFLREYDIQEPGRNRVIRASYGLLGLISFFTGNEQEVRAWTLGRGATALEAADKVHSDMARGFIRAEVIPWDELVSLGGLAQARSAGKLRLEGKDYVVEDGDVIYIRFAV